MARARSGKSIQTKLSFLIYGDKGTWKSSLCLEFAKMVREDGKPFRLLYIDAESGSVDDYITNLEEEGYDTSNIYIVYTQSIAEIKHYIQAATKNEPLYELDEDGNETDVMVLDADGEQFKADAIVLDGSTVLYTASQQGLLEFSKMRAGVRANQKQLVGKEKIVAIEGAGIEVKDYQTLKFKGQDFVLDLMATGKHFAITARETDEKVSKQDSDNKFQSVSTGKKIPDGFKGMDYNVKTVLHMYMDDNGTVKAQVESKDRTQVKMQNEVLDKPSLLDWAVVIDKNKGKKEFVLGNQLQSSVNAEQLNYEKEIDNTSTTTGENTASKETPEYYRILILDVINKLPIVKRKTLQTIVTKAGLPIAYQEMTDIEQLKKYLAVITG